MTRNNAVVSQIRFLLMSMFLIPPVLAHAQDQQPQRSPAQTDKIAAKVIRIGIRADVTVKLYNGKTYHGFINRIDDEQFEISEVDLKTSVVIRYDQVRNVERGYGEKGPLGNRVGKKGRRIGTIIAVATTVVLSAIVIAGVREH